MLYITRNVQKHARCVNYICFLFCKDKKNTKCKRHQKINNPKPMKSKEPYDIKHSTELGRYLVANRNIAKGETVIEEIPLAIGPGADSNTVCLGCYATINIENVTYRCTACSWPLCSANCPGIGMVYGHTKWECELLKEKQIADKLYTTNAEEVKEMYELILPLRILELKKVDPNRYDAIMNMESHINARKDNYKIWNRYQLVVVNRLITSWNITEYSEELIHTVCGILDVNCFEIGQNQSKGRALYLNAFLLAHECSCNTTHTDDIGEHKMTIRASRNIKKDEQITLNYAYTLQGTYKRRQFLYEGKSFWCSCRRCADPTELGTNLSAINCTNCSVGDVLQINPLDQCSQWKCRSCCHEIPYQRVVLMLDLLYNELEDINPHDIINLEAFIRRSKKILCSNHYLILSAKYSLCQVYGRIQGFLINELSNDDLKRKEQYCKDLLSVVDILEPGLSRLRGLLMYELHAPIMVTANRQFSLQQINIKKYQEFRNEVVSLLKNSEAILCLEPKNSSEYIMAVAAKETLENMGAY